MSEEAVRRAAERFERDQGFEETGERAFEDATTPFEATVELSAADDDRIEVRTTVRPPMLDAVVEGETVAPVVEDGWFETLELRLADAHTVVLADDAGEVSVARDDGRAVATLTFRTDDPDRAVSGARSFVDYVEGTWMQGVVPGYEYGEPAAGMVEKATQNYDEN